ncbi:unnamed protein product [Lampetra planeri]
MADAPGPPEGSPLRGPPHGCPGAVAGATRVAKSSKTARSHPRPSSAPGDVDGPAPAMTSCTLAVSPATDPSALSLSGTATAGGSSPSSSEEGVD